MVAVSDPARAVTEQASRDTAGSLARPGAVSFVGAAGGAVLGFALTLVLASSLGSSGAGVVLQVIGIFTIALSLAQFGMDTGVVFQLPRLLISDPARVRGAVMMALATGAIVGTALAAGIAGFAAIFIEPGQIRDAMVFAVWALPFGAAMGVALSAMRALGGVVGYVAIGSLLVPLLRPIGVLVAVAMIGASSAAPGSAAMWAVPFVVGAALAIAVLLGQLRRIDAQLDADGERSRLWPTRAVASELANYSARRMFATTMQQALLWLDVVVVGVLAGAGAAGVYGTASRFVAAGLIIDTALRIVVSPVFSRLMYQKRRAEAEQLFRTVTVWLVWFSTPIYVLLALNAATILGWFGSDFVGGAACMVILCVASGVTLCAGNIHTMLLMSGYSGWSAFNKAVVLVVNVVGNLVAVPRWGIEGAATVWAVSMLLDAALASVEVRILTGMRLSIGPVGRALAGVVLTVGSAGALAVWLVGPGLVGVVGSAAAGLLCWAVLTWADRGRLNLASLAVLRRD